MHIHRILLDVYVNIIRLIFTNNGVPIYKHSFSIDGFKGGMTNYILVNQMFGQNSE